jgi:ion channel-forming bestrophin family protein
LELIAEEIENPFGTDANDLPLNQICKNIQKHIGEILD